MSVSKELVAMYPEAERDLFYANQKLQEELLIELKRVSLPEEKDFVDCFVSDGFYPYFTTQKCKVLFIGKESLGIGGCDYIDVLIDGIKSNDPRGLGSKCSNDRDPFLSKLLYVTYGLNHNCCENTEIPYASEIGTEKFAVKEGISFAIMNFSKFDNPSESSYSADYARMNLYCDMLERTGRNWHEDQIALLNPDLIISMNISEWIARVFKRDIWEIWDKKGYDLGIPEIDLGYLPVKGKMVPIINTWHFSAPGKAFYEHFYNPIVRSIREYFTTLNTKLNG